MFHCLKYVPRFSNFIGALVLDIMVVSQIKVLPCNAGPRYMALAGRNTITHQSLCTGEVVNRNMSVN